VTDNRDAEPQMPRAAAKTAIVVYGKHLGRKLTVCTDKDRPVPTRKPQPKQPPSRPDEGAGDETEEEAAERQAEFERQREACEEQRQRREAAVRTGASRNGGRVYNTSTTPPQNAPLTPAITP
jgi:ParB family transcriptional regulator, chromosome partitioning protein